MPNKTYNRLNFHSHTFCIWKETNPEDIKSLKVDFKSKSGSQYIFSEMGVYRISNHWGRAANCRWRLLPLGIFKNQHVKIGYAGWSDFYPNDETSRLFYIKVDFDTNDVAFHHKDSPGYDGRSVLRNAAATAKTIKTITQVLTETHWAGHLRYDNLEDLRQEVVSELLYTEKSFIAIKQKHHQL